MIFVTVGTQKFQFDRLLRQLDKLCDENNIKEEIVAQIGYSKYKPKNFKTYKMLDSSEIEKYVRECDLLITHGGTSSIFQALKVDKKVIAVPRLQKFDEHVDNHQVEICKILEDKGYISVVWDIENLLTNMKESHNKPQKKYRSSSMSLVNEIKNYIKS